ncbi:MAG: hemerythrin family protein [Thermodesulfobacteriota bacterium]
MKTLEWYSTLETGSTNVDAEHKIFFNLINKLIHAITSGRDNDYLARLILEIQKYAEFHFISEENLMIDLGCPDIDAHRKLHLRLLEKFNITLNSLELDKESYENFAQFLIDWFQSHTINEDKKIGAFLQEEDSSTTLECS